MVKGSQKVNPIGWRIGVHRKWKTTWFQENKNYTNFLIINLKINEMIKNFLNYHPKKSLLINVNIFKNSMDKLFIFIFYYRYRFFMKKRFKKLKKIQSIKKNKLMRSLSYNDFRMFNLQRKNLKISIYSNFFKEFYNLKNYNLIWKNFIFSNIQKNWIFNYQHLNFFEHIFKIKKYLILNSFLNKNVTNKFIISYLKFLFNNQNFNQNFIKNYIINFFKIKVFTNLKLGLNFFIKNNIFSKNNQYSINFNKKLINNNKYNLLNNYSIFKLLKKNKFINYYIYKDILKQQCFNNLSLYKDKIKNQKFFYFKNIYENNYLFNFFNFKFLFLKNFEIKNQKFFIDWNKLKNNNFFFKSNDIFFYDKKLTFNLTKLKKILQILTKTKTSLVFINTLSLYLFFSRIWYKSLNTLKSFAWKSFKLRRKKRFFFLEKFANSSEQIFKRRFQMGIHHVKDLVYISLLTIVLKRPNILAKFIGFQIKNLPKKRKQIPFIRQIMKLILSLTGRKDILGACIQIKGRFDRWSRTKSLISSTGILPLQTFNINIEYGSSKGIVRKGTFGIRVWIRYKKSFNWLYKHGFEQYFYYSKLKNK